MPRKITSTKTSEKPEESMPSVSHKIQKEPQTMKELMEEYSSSFKIPKRGTFMEGMITRVSPKEIRIDVGSKIEGIVMDKEMELFKDLVHELKVGEKVNVYVVSSENKQGQLILSVRRHALDMKWNRFTDSMAKDEVVTIRALEINKGGAIVNAEGLQGFLPTSQMDPSRLNNLNNLINRLLQAKVIEVNQKENRLIFSERAFMEVANAAKAEELKKLIDPEKEYVADVVGVTNFGAFVKVHVTYVEGEESSVEVEEIKEEKNQAASAPPAGVATASRRKKVKGPQKEVVVEGLVHISEISWDKVDDIAKFLKVGDKIKVLILGVDQRTGKVNCSMKQLTVDPWAGIAANYTIDEKVDGKVSRITDYGIFVMLEGGIEGLIHITKVPPGKTFEADEKVRCTIESIDAKHRKISLVPVVEGKFVGYR
jgi:ribosomal protein S1